MLHRTGKFAVVLALAAGLGGCADDLGPELEALDAKDSRIVFQAPELRGKIAKFMRSRNARQSAMIERAYWVGPEARHAKAWVEYVELSPNYHFRRATDVGEVIKDFQSFSDKELKIADEAWEVNDLGRIRYRHFGFDDTACIVFGQLFGSTGSERVGGETGDKRILGYYCADPGNPLGADVTKQILTSIDLRP